METVILLWGLGIVAGLDLVSVPQIMVARPLVAGTLAGLITGDPTAGVLTGAVLELFALDVLPVGAARYPDYGPAAVVAAATATGAPAVLGLGAAVSIGLVVAYAGEQGIHWVRRRNAADVRRHHPQLALGDPSAVRSVHARGVARDALRAALVTAGGLLAADVLRRWPPVSVSGALALGVVVTGAALAAGTVAALRTAGPGAGTRWFAFGLLSGIGWVVVT